MSEMEFQAEVLARLSAIEGQLRQGERRMEGQDGRLRTVECAVWEAKGRYAMIAAFVAGLFSLASIWIGKRM
jgi:hypothetical protein